eukprot:gb/GECG01016498.1/.p1 GENE.gb/GECG01016498.1/~~gb/GECG01016498.1/.p1  ORF type:complete len:712 (+),score=62.37 gb/GECG01016498.1/:1-2136(+)
MGAGASKGKKKGHRKKSNHPPKGPQVVKHPPRRLNIAYIYADPLYSPDDEQLDHRQTRVDVARERSYIIEQVSMYAITWYDAIATRETFDKVLDHGIDILHYVGRGRQLPAGDTYGIALEDHDRDLGCEETVTANEIERILKTHSPPSIIIVSGYGTDIAAKVLMQAGAKIVLTVPKENDRGDGGQRTNAYVAKLYENLLKGVDVATAHQKSTPADAEQPFRLVPESKDKIKQQHLQAFPAKKASESSPNWKNSVQPLEWDEQPHKWILGRHGCIQSVYQKICRKAQKGIAGRGPGVLVLWGRRGLGKSTIARSVTGFILARSDSRNQLTPFPNVITLTVEPGAEMDGMLQKKTTTNSLLLVHIYTACTQWRYNPRIADTINDIPRLCRRFAILHAIVTVSVADYSAYDVSNTGIEFFPPIKELDEQAITLILKQRLSRVIGENQNEIVRRLEESDLPSCLHGRPANAVRCCERLAKCGYDFNNEEIRWHAKNDTNLCDEEVYLEASNAVERISHAALLTGYNRDQPIPWEEDSITSAIIEFASDYVQELTQPRLEDMRQSLVDKVWTKPYLTPEGTFKLYMYCVEVLMPVLWLIKFGVSEWWQAGHRPLIYGCNTKEEEFPPGNFFYRLSSSVAGAITLTYRFLEGGTSNVRISFTPCHGLFYFEADLDVDGSKSTWTSWEEVHREVERKTINRFYSQKTLLDIQSQDPS